MTIVCPCCGKVFYVNTTSDCPQWFREIKITCSDGNIPPDGYEFGELKGGEENGRKREN